jgi:antirestriction protein
MSITLTANYKEVLKQETVEFIEENCVEGEYDLDDALKFIDEHNEDDFVAYYDEYIRCGEAIGYDAVDAFIEEMGCISYVENCDDKYRGEYRSEADFAEEYYSDLYDVPCALVVDWEATWETSLRYDFTFCDGYVFSDY